jgi:hypothetical protein
MRNARVLAALLLAIAAPQLVQAQESDREDAALNSIELFLGGTIDDNDLDASIGIGYERRLSQQFGVGGLVEATGGRRDWVFAVPVLWHPVEPWRFLVAPGFERSDGDNELLIRVGGTYEIEFDGWSLTPELNLDFVDGDVLTVLGVTFGWKF